MEWAPRVFCAFVVSFDSTIERNKYERSYEKESGEGGRGIVCFVFFLFYFETLPIR